MSSNTTLTQIYGQPSGKEKSALWKTKPKNKRKKGVKQKTVMTDYFKINKKYIKSKKIKNKIMIYTNKAKPACRCGDMILETAKTEKNHGKKYWRCKKWKIKTQKSCGGFIWNDQFKNTKKKLKKTIII